VDRGTIFFSGLTLFGVSEAVKNVPNTPSFRNESSTSYLGGHPKCTTYGQLKMYRGRWPLENVPPLTGPVRARQRRESADMNELSVTEQETIRALLQLGWSKRRTARETRPSPRDDREGGEARGGRSGEVDNGKRLSTG